MATVVEQDSTSDAALARKHRIAMRSRQRSVSSVSSASCSTDEEETSSNGRNNKRPRVALCEAVEEEEPMVVGSSTAEDSDSIMQSIAKKKPHITGIKMQSRYDPGVSMTKVELKTWRKEARRVRNRESAAQSRQKNRQAIDTLETEVKGMQTKYDAALRYILHLEDQLRRERSVSSFSSSSSFCPSTVLRQDLEGIRKASPDGEEVTAQTQTVSPPHSPTPVDIDPIPLGIGLDYRTPQEEEQQRRQWPVQVLNDPDKNTSYYHPLSRHHHHNHPTLNSQKHIIDTMIIRPIACV